MTIFDDLFEDCCTSARKVLLGAGAHTPQLILRTGADVIFAGIDYLPEDFDVRHELIAKTAELARRGAEGHTLIAVYFICEAWVSSSPAGAPAPTRPRDDPNRVECLVVAGRDIAAGAPLRCWAAQIIRVDGVPIEVLPLVEQPKAYQLDLLDAAEVGWRR